MTSPKSSFWTGKMRVCFSLTTYKLITLILGYWNTVSEIRRCIYLPMTIEAVCYWNVLTSKSRLKVITFGFVLLSLFLFHLTYVWTICGISLPSHTFHCLFSSLCSVLSVLLCSCSCQRNESSRTAVPLPHEFPLLFPLLLIGGGLDT